MKEDNKFWKSIISGVLIVALMFCTPFESIAQSSNRANLLETDSQVVLRVAENFKAEGKAESGIINAVVASDVYSADGSRVLISAGTPASLEFTAESNGYWGKAGKICITNASSKTIDNKRVSLRLSTCKQGGGKLGGVIVLSVLLFPIGLLSGFMKGGMPKIQQGTTFNAFVLQNVVVE